MTFKGSTVALMIQSEISLQKMNSLAADLNNAVK
jgi:hypothetical protein